MYSCIYYQKLTLAQMFSFWQDLIAILQGLLVKYTNTHKNISNRLIVTPSTLIYFLWLMNFDGLKASVHILDKGQTKLYTTTATDLLFGNSVVLK